MTTRTFLLLYLLTMLSNAVPVLAAESVEGDRFSLSLGAFLTHRDSKTRLDGETAKGTKTKLERDLGLSSSDNVFRVDGYYRFNDRHRLDFSVFDLSREGSKQIGRNIQWGDTLFGIDTVVEANFDLTIYKAAYTYTFKQHENGYLGTTFGLYTLDTRVSLEEQILGQPEVGDITAPLPVIGLRGDYEFTDKWTFRASGEFFFIKFEHVKGSLIDVYAVLDYAVRDSVSVGLGFNSVVMNLDASTGGFTGSLDWQYSGALLFLKFDF